MTAIFSQGRRKLKFERILTSTRTQKNMGDMKTALGLAPGALGRFAICLSLKDRSIPNPDEYNEDGTELPPHVLFGEHERVYHALFLNRLKRDRLDPELYLNSMLRAHLNRGFISLKLRIKTLGDFYTLVREERLT